MVDITAKLFWFRSKEWCAAMADKLTDIVYTDDSKETINVINLLLLGWILLGLVVYIIGNVIATYLRKRKSSVAAVDRSNKPETPTTPADDSVPCANDIQKFREDSVSSQTIIPTCEGEDEEFVNWINKVTSWIYTQRVVSPIIDSWLSALNARTRLSSTEHGILVDFRDLLPTSGPPKVTEVRQNTYSRYEDTNLTCDMEFENIAFEIVVTQFKEKEKILLPFILQVKRLFGKVSIECIPEDVSFTAKYSEPPQIEMHPEASNGIEVPQDEYEPLCDVVSEITSDALSSVIVPLRLSCFPDCPRMPTKYTPEDVYETAESESGQKLLVKIIKANNLGGSKGCLKPYCVVEMIDPPQKFETQVVEGTQSPFWDEAYTFVVKDPAELLFEIYDKDKSTSEGFLGLGIVNTEELMRNPSQRQIIPLQSRPLEEDDVTGALTVEFLFVDLPSPSLESTRFGPPPKQEVGKTVETNSRVTAGGTVITTTTIKRTKEERSAIIPEAKSNPNANSNSNLHGTEEMLHPQTPNALAEREPELSSPVLLSTQETIDPKLFASDQWSNSNDQTIAQKLDSVSKNVDQTQDLIARDENKAGNSLVLTGNQKIDLPGEISDLLLKCGDLKPDLSNKMDEQEINSTIPNGGLKLDSTGKIVEQKIDPLIKNGDLRQDLSGKIIDQGIDSIIQEVYSLTQNGYQKHDSFTLSHPNDHYSPGNNSDLIREIDSKMPSNDHKALNGTSTDGSSGRPIEEAVSQGIDVPKTVNKSVPVIKPPPLPTILVEEPLKNGSAQMEALEDLPTIAEDVEGSNNVENSMDGGEDVAGTALKELEKQHHSTPSEKSTLIIHSVHRVSMDTSGRWQEVTEPESSMSDSLEASPARSQLSNSRGSYAESDPSSPTLDSQEEENRSRPKEKRSFMGTLRRKLSFHKARSKSAENRYENGATSNYSQASSRSASTDRIRHPPTPTHNRLSPFKGRKLLGGQLLSPAAAGSTRSSLSEASGISAATYINENSTLVIETNENGIVKRYLIPNSLVHRSKWKKRGTKLHIFNDHVFIAKHLSGSTMCQVCKRHLTRRPGKQGYECRGCDLQCHKSCHVKVDSYCSNSSINSMEVEYIHDPKGASPKSI